MAATVGKVQPFDPRARGRSLISNSSAAGRPPPGGLFAFSDRARRKPANPQLLRRFRERRKNPRPGADALVEALEVVLLVRRMDVVVVEAEADQHGVEAERALEIRHDRDRAA